MSLKRKQVDQSNAPGGTTDVFRSEPIEDRQSTFIGFFSPTLKPKELQKLTEIADADHKIVAWRRESNQQSITKAKQYVVGSDDDGEKYAGKKLEKVLDGARAEGSVLVARYWGGVMLGPARFEHIENCAKDAFRQWQNQEVEKRNKKIKMDEEEAEHARLSKALVDRDQSIEVLRKLASEKETKVKALDETPEATSAQDENASATSASSAKVATDYSVLPLARLRALDKARDATLSFLLKRIDKAEAELAAQAQGDSAEKPP